MTRRPATEAPHEPGYYVVWIHLSDRPIILWWSRMSTRWLYGAQQVKAVEWMGPL